MQDLKITVGSLFLTQVFIGIYVPISHSRLNSFDVPSLISIWQSFRVQWMLIARFTEIH